MEEWKTYKVGDICSSISETYKSKSKSVVLINTSDVLEGRCLNHEFVPNKDLKGQFKKVFKFGDILYSEIRPANKRFAYIDFDATDYIASTKLMVLRNNDKVTNRFLYHYLKSESTISELQALAESRSGTFPQITFSELSQLEISIPDIETQLAISSFIDTLESKIELNRQINDNLEQQAQALYKSWFVDFEPFKDGEFFESEFGLIPEGWRVGALSDLTEITMGQSPSGKSYNETGDGMLFYQGRAEFGDRYPSIRLYTTEPSRIAEQNSVLLSVRAPVGDTNIAYNKCCIGRGLASIKAKHGFNSFIFYMVKSLKDQFDLYNGEGTVFGSINRDSLNSMKVIVPTNDVISDFEKIVAPLDFKYKSLFTENLLLTQQRDTLLPKLMSGELKINEIDC